MTSAGSAIIWPRRVVSVSSAGILAAARPVPLLICEATARPLPLSVCEAATRPVPLLDLEAAARPEIRVGRFVFPIEDSEDEQLLSLLLVTNCHELHHVFACACAIQSSPSL